MKQVKNKIYLVRYCGGSYEDYYDKVIFATTVKSRATKYVTRFNRILKKWKEHYKQFENDKLGMKWIADEYVELHFERWYEIKNINRCYCEEVEVR